MGEVDRYGHKSNVRLASGYLLPIPYFKFKNKKEIRMKKFTILSMFLSIVLMGCGCWPKADPNAEPKALTSLKAEINGKSAEQLKQEIYLEKLEVLKKDLGGKGDARAAAKVQDEIDSIKNPKPAVVAPAPAAPVAPAPAAPAPAKVNTPTDAGVQAGKAAAADKK